MTALSIIIDVVLILVSLILIIAVLMQEGQRQGLGAIGGGAETFFGKNAASSVDGKLKRITKIVAAVFIVLAVVATMVTSHINAPADSATDTNPIVEELEDGSHVHEDGTVHDADGNVVESTDGEDAAEATEAPDAEATEAPAEEATEAPAGEPTEAPAEATDAPADEPTEEPAAEPTAEA